MYVSIVIHDPGSDIIVYSVLLRDHSAQQASRLWGRTVGSVLRKRPRRSHCDYIEQVRASIQTTNWFSSDIFSAVETATALVLMARCE